MADDLHRFANSQVGHGQPMIKPNVSEMFDFEGEMAVIIEALPACLWGRRTLGRGGVCML